MENIKYLFFDIGYTLVNEDQVWKQRCMEQAGKEEAKRIGLTAEDIFNEIVSASKNYLPQYTTVVNKFGFSDVAPYRHEFEQIYGACENVLKKLSSKYKLGIIANQSEGLQKRLEEFGILKYFSLIVSSWDYQIMKPDKKLFALAVDRANCVASETVMIGDRLDNDIFPAKEVGMKTVWIRQGFGGMQKPMNDRYIPDVEISNLEELLMIF